MSTCNRLELETLGFVTDYAPKSPQTLQWARVACSADAGGKL